MLTVLIVEDSLPDRQIYLRAISEFKDVEVLEAGRAEEAMRLMCSRNIDLFLLDVELPEMDGFTLARKIRALTGYRLTPILFVTGYSRNPLEAFREFHCYDYIIKPFDVEEFSQKVKILLLDLNRNVKIEQKLKKLVLLRTQSGNFFCQVDEIRFIEVNWGGCYVHTGEASIQLLNASLAKTVREIGEDFLVQCSRACAVNVKQITAVQQVNYRLWRIHLCDYADTVEMTVRFKEQVEAATKKYAEIKRRGEQ